MIRHKMIPVDLGIQSLSQFNLYFSGWFSADDGLNLANQLLAASYQICGSLHKPDDIFFPWNVRQVLDIGQGGGKELGVRCDAKNGAGKKKTKKTNVFDRLQSNILDLTSDNENLIEKLKNKTEDNAAYLLNQMFRNKRDRLWVSFVSPDIADTKLMRDFKCEVTLIESVMMQLYKNRWGDVPFGNPAHSSKSVGVIEGSFTSEDLKSPTLEEFFI